VAAASRYGDLALLGLCLPVFVIAGWPLLGYAVGAGAWLAQRGIRLAADRRASRALAAGDRRAALGTLAVAALGRVWLSARAVLLVGLAERESGLAAAILCAALFTVYLTGQVLVRVLDSEGGG
jgi:hypothetical protein